MPVRAEPKERPIIRMLLLACDNGAWQNAHLDWVEEKEDGAVEVIATRADGTRLALEHTLIQPFVGEKFDSEVFMRAFGRIEKNPALTLAERQLDVIIPVNAIPKGYNWDDVGQDLLDWLRANQTAVPQEGQASYVVPVAAKAKNGPLALPVAFLTLPDPEIEAEGALDPLGLSTIGDRLAEDTSFTFDSTFFETECLGRFLQMDTHPAESESVGYLKASGVKTRNGKVSFICCMVGRNSL